MKATIAIFMGMIGFVRAEYVRPDNGQTCQDLTFQECMQYSGCIWFQDAPAPNCRVRDYLPPTGKCGSQNKMYTCINWDACQWDEVEQKCMFKPTDHPVSSSPTMSPTMSPSSKEPTDKPSTTPTNAPTAFQTTTNAPTNAPTESTVSPTLSPTITNAPTGKPTDKPTASIDPTPKTNQPTSAADSMFDSTTLFIMIGLCIAAFQ